MLASSMLRCQGCLVNRECGNKDRAIAVECLRSLVNKAVHSRPEFRRIAKGSDRAVRHGYRQLLESRSAAPSPGSPPNLD